MKTKHCPYCDSERLNYVLNIFEPRNSKKRYTGEVNCSVCKKEFNKKKIKIKYWNEVSFRDYE